MSSNSQQQLSTSFGLIWYYWFKKYMIKKGKKASSLQQLTLLKQKYCIQSVQTHNLQSNSSNLRKKIQQIKQKACLTSSSSVNPSSISASLSGSQSATTSNTNSLSLSISSPPNLYIINPQSQSKQIEQVLQNEETIDQQQKNQMINQLYSYYLNTKCVFVIYKKEKDSRERGFSSLEKESNLLTSDRNQKNQRQRDRQRDRGGNTTERLQSRGKLALFRTTGNSYQGSLLNSKVGFSSLLDDSIGIDRNDSILQSYDKIQDQIQNLEILGRFWEHDGIQIWDVKYYSMPHSFIKIKKPNWSKSLIQPSTPISSPLSLTHPSQPKTISSLPITPRIQKHRPNPDKLPSFLTFMQQLWQKMPMHSPLCQSIFQYNCMPYIFVQDFKQESIAVLCFYIAYGDQNGELCQKYVERWIQANPYSAVSKSVKFMRQLQRNRVGLRGSQGQVKGLLFQHTSDVIW